MPRKNQPRSRRQQSHNNNNNDSKKDGRGTLTLTLTIPLDPEKPITSPLIPVEIEGEEDEMLPAWYRKLRVQRTCPFDDDTIRAFNEHSKQYGFSLTINEAEADNDALEKIFVYSLDARDMDINMPFPTDFMPQSVIDAMYDSIMRHQPQYSTRRYCGETELITLPDGKFGFNYNLSEKIGNIIDVSKNERPAIHHLIDFDKYSTTDMLLEVLSEETLVHRKLYQETSPPEGVPPLRSMFRMWTDEAELIIIDAIQRYDIANAFTIWSVIRERNQIPPIIGINYYCGLMGLFSPKSVLDVFSNLGGGMISAIKGGVDRYIGVDPYRWMEDGNKAIITYLSERDEKAKGYKFLRKDPRYIDEDDLDNEEVDMICSTPMRSGEESYITGDPMDRYNELGVWRDEIMPDTYANVWKFLKKGGVLTVLISNRDPATKAVETIHSIIDQLPGAIYLGMIVSGGARGKQMLTWCWQKEM